MRGQRFSRTDSSSLSGPVISRKPGLPPTVIIERRASRYRSRVYKRDAGQCQYCGRDVSYQEAHIDHVHPWYYGGKTSIPNLVTSCPECNRRKGKQLIPRDLQPDTRPSVGVTLWRRLDQIPDCRWPVEPSETHRLHIWDAKHQPKRRHKR